MDNILVGSKIKGLYPVCDYWQLIADDAIVNINNPFQFFYQGKVQLGSELDENLIRGKGIIAENYVDDEYYEVILENNISIRISLVGKDYTCPEAVNIYSAKTGEIIVF